LLRSLFVAAADLASGKAADGGADRRSYNRARFLDAHGADALNDAIFEPHRTADLRARVISLAKPRGARAGERDERCGAGGAQGSEGGF
jgi:hypothetical protein